MPRTVSLVILLLALVASLVVLSYAGILKLPDAGRNAATTEQPAQTRPNQATASGNIATPVPAQFRTLKGTIKSISASTLTVNTETGSETLSLSQTTIYQKLVSGTLSGGNAKTTPVILADLKAGQEVMVVAKLSSDNILSVLIVK